MDFGVLGLEGLVGPENGAPSHSYQVSVIYPPEAMTKPAGSVFVKPERSGSDDDDKGSFKIAKTVDFSASKTMPSRQATALLRSNSVVSGNSTRQQEQMLSFSSYKSEVPFLTRTNGLVERSSQATAFPFFQHIPSASAYTRSAGYGSGSLNASMHGLLSGARGPFTPAQWMELEHQALIFKYIIANVPVPSNLLVPIRKSLYPFGLPFSGSYAPNSYGWGTFHLGYSGNTDPEPGRCRRTDGKKWRCSRDAVADQKYCERHINRGRHRSRKPVEGQTGQAASGTTNSKVVPMTSSVSTSVITSGGASNSLAVTQHEFKNLQPVAANPCAEALVSRVQDSRSVSMMSSTINLKQTESTLSVPKQEILLKESSQSVFGLVSSDSLLNPSQRSSYLNSKSYGGSFPGFNDQETQEQLPLRQFIDEWPKDESNHSVITWPEELKSDWTQLSMSIPIVSSEFSSSSCSPADEKLAPLELDSNQVGLGMNNDFGDSNQKQTNWIPISWGTSMGGPLGEVLTNTSNNVGTCKNSTSPNLLTEGWDGSPHLGSSPTGVLHKSTFCSLSNSSSGSSPITENKKTHDGASLCDDVVGSNRLSSSIPSL